MLLLFNYSYLNNNCIFLYIFEKKIKIKMHLTFFSFCYIIFLIASITTFILLNSYYYFVLYSYLHFNMTKTTIIQKRCFFLSFLFSQYYCEVDNYNITTKPYIFCIIHIILTNFSRICLIYDIFFQIFCNEDKRFYKGIYSNLNVFLFYFLFLFLCLF